METFGLTGIDFGTSLKKLGSIVRPSPKKFDKPIQKNNQLLNESSKLQKLPKEYYTGFKPKSNQQSRNMTRTIIKNVKQKQSLSGFKTDLQLVKVLGKSEKKFETLKSVVERIKHDNKEMSKTQFFSCYDNQISNAYDELYGRDSRKKVLKGLLQLENKQFLQKDLKYRENQEEQNKKKYNMLKYEVQQKSQALENLKSQIEQIENIFPKTYLLTNYNDQKDEYKQLRNKIKQELLREESLQHMQDFRRKIVLFEKNQCKTLSNELYFVKSHIQAQLNHKRVRDNFRKELQSQYSFLNKKHQQILEANGKDNSFQEQQDEYSFALPSKEQLGKKFNEMFEDALSEYEETNAIQKIFEHEREIEINLQNRMLEEKQAIQQQNNQQRQKLINKLTGDRNRTLKALDTLHGEFRSIKQITNIQQLDDLNNHRNKYENEKESMEKIERYLADEIIMQRKVIGKLKEQVKTEKFNKEFEQEKLNQQVQFDNLEKTLLSKRNHTQEFEYQIQKLERTIDGVSLIISRILYQLSNQKFKNIEVKREDLLNSLSVSGLKLERMLTVLLKKKTNFRIESINTDGTENVAPEYLGLNSKKVYLTEEYKQLNERSLNDVNDADILYMKKESDTSFIEDEEYLTGQVVNIKKINEKSIGKDKDNEQDKSNLRLKKLKGLND